MGSEKRKGYGSYIICIVVYLVVLALLCFTWLQVKRRNEVMLQHNAEIYWNNMLMELTTLDNVPSVVESQDNLLGIVIMDTNGSIRATSGEISNPSYVGWIDEYIASAPARGNDLQKGVITKNRSVILTKSWTRLDWSRPYSTTIFVTAEFSMMDLWVFFHQQKIVFILVNFLFIICLVLCMRMIKKNKDYEANFETNQSLIQLGEAARTLSHEIKNPLSAIIMETAILRKQIDPSFHEDLDIINEEVDRLARLSNRIGQFLNNPKGNPEVIEVSNTITQLIMRFSQPISFSYAQEYFVLFDPDQLRSVLENLIKNAIESGEAKEDNSVSITLQKQGKDLVIEVLDRGEGLGSTGKSVFDPFFTTKIHGAGIGLAIVRRFVQAAQGSIELKNREGGGAVARVTLPLVKR